MGCLKTICGVVAVGAVLAGASASFGADILSFTYSDLDGDFTATSGLFAAVDDADSDGDVTRLVSPVGDAFFAGTLADNGFPGLASFNVTMTVTSATTDSALVVPGAATITLSDVDADVFTGMVEGTWYNLGGSANFVGLISGFLPVNTSGDGTFDGTDGSSISMDFGEDLPFDGNIITLAFGTWFTDGSGTAHDFSDATTLASGAVVPEPAMLSLMVLSGLAISMRRRRQ